jgi:Ca2+-binding EF-hand superfamily protein
MSVLRSAKKLNFTRRDVDRLWQSFSNMDLDHDGKVSIHEFIVMKKISLETFATMVFDLIGHEGSGEIAFEDYMISLWCFCSVEQEELAQFVFEIFDTDGSGALSQDEVRHMVKIILGPEKTTVVQSLINRFAEFTGEDKDDISLQDFITMTQTSPVLMYRAFQMQQIFCAATIGSSRWKRVQKSNKATFGKRSTLDVVGTCLGLQQRTNSLERIINQEKKQNEAPLSYRRKRELINEVSKRLRPRPQRKFVSGPQMKTINEDKALSNWVLDVGDNSSDEGDVNDEEVISYDDYSAATRTRTNSSCTTGNVSEKSDCKLKMDSNDVLPNTPRRKSFTRDVLNSVASFLQLTGVDTDTDADPACSSNSTSRNASPIRNTSPSKKKLPSLGKKPTSAGDRAFDSFVREDGRYRRQFRRSSKTDKEPDGSFRRHSYHHDMHKYVPTLSRSPSPSHYDIHHHQSQLPSSHLSAGMKPRRKSHSAASAPQDKEQMHALPSPHKQRRGSHSNQLARRSPDKNKSSRRPSHESLNDIIHVRKISSDTKLPMYQRGATRNTLERIRTPIRQSKI